MRDDRLLRDGTQITALAERLLACPQAVQYDTDDEQEAWTLSATLSDLEESCHTFLDVLLPRLCAGDLPAADVLDVLLELGEEFRHIRYHLGDTQFYAYLADQGDA